MFEQLEENFTAVVCLHCGMHTRVPVSTSRSDSSGAVPIATPAVSLVRCEGCGKEAPYLANDIFEYKAKASTIRSAA